MSSRERPRFNPAVVWRKEEKLGVFLLYNPENDELYSVEPLGIRILELCDGKRTVSDIQRIVNESIASAQKVPKEDVNTYLKLLEKENVIEFV